MIPFEILDGTPYEMGFQSGTRFREFVKHSIYELLAQRKPSPRAVDECWKAIMNHLPDVAEEIEGNIASIGLPEDYIIWWNCREDVELLPATACTGVAFKDGSDGPMVAKSTDGDRNSQLPFYSLRLYRPKGGMPFFSLGYPGSARAELAFNEAGLCIGISGLISKETDVDGIFWNILTRGCIAQCETTAEAERFFADKELRRFGFCLITGDARGDIAVIEKVVGAQATRRAVAKVIYESNVPLDMKVLASTASYIDDLNYNGRRRWQVLRKIFADEADLDTSLDAMQKIFCHHGQPASICQHEHGLFSGIAAFALCARKRFILSDGQTCERNFRTFDFDKGEIFAEKD